jgi:pimeloyl-ACP methyl ester carboxylesterase
MQRFARGPLSFDVTDEGPADGEVVVLLHGYPEDRTCWSGVLPGLLSAGLRVLAPDQRGYSPGARPRRRRDYALHELTDDVLALVDASGAERVHLVGHDWGGAVAWAFATAYPERLRTVTSLATPHPRALASSLLTSTQALHSWYIAAFQLPVLPEAMVRAAGGRATARALVRSGLPPEAAQRYASRLQDPGAARGALNWYRGMPLSRSRSRTRPASGPVRVPTLYVYATGDAFLGRRAAELTARHVAAPYRFEVLDGASHWLPDEAPDLVARLLLEHIATALP